MSDSINQLDLAFVVDTTGSMSSVIAAAQRQMVALIDELSRAAEVDMRLAIVEYRDHPPQDRMVTRVYSFTGDLRRAQTAIHALRAEGGGDEPEAVLDGVLSACHDLTWRPHARRIAMLIGDAPPHGSGAAGDSFPRGCPCGQTIESVTAAAERVRVTLYAIGLNGSVTEPFSQLSRATGGEFFPAQRGDAALARLKQILIDEFGNLEFDRRVLIERRDAAELSIGELAVRLGSTRLHVAAAISRLERRELIGS